MTRYGEALLRRARRASDELDQARRELARLPGSAARIRAAPVFSMQVSEQRLRAFVALTELQHMPTVANQFGITQPAVSAAVRELGSEPRAAAVRAYAQGNAAERSRRGPGAARQAIARRTAPRAGRDRVPARKHPGSHHRRRPAARPHADTAAGDRPGGVPPSGTSHRDGRRTVRDPGRCAALGDVDFILGALRPPGYAIDLVGEPLLSEELAIVARADHPLFLKPRTTLAGRGPRRVGAAAAGDPDARPGRGAVRQGAASARPTFAWRPAISPCCGACCSKAIS